MGISNKNKKKYLTLSKYASNGGLRDYLSEEKQETIDEEAKVQALKEQMFNQAGVHDDEKETGEKKMSPVKKKMWTMILTTTMKMMTIMRKNILMTETMMEWMMQEMTRQHFKE